MSGQMDSNNSTLLRQQQQQRRGDHFFITSREASQSGAGSTRFYQLGDGRNAHWRSRPSASASGVDGMPEYERTKFVASSPTGKIQEEDLGVSMFRRGGGRGVLNTDQGGKEFSGLLPPSTGKPRSSENNNEASPSSIKTFKHPHPAVREPSSNKRQRQGEPTEAQEDIRLSLVSRPQSSPGPTAETKGLAGGGKSLAPLSERMRPASLDLVVGQDHLLGPRSMIRSLIDNNTPSSIILWGHPGSGKTSLVRAISRSVSFRYIELSAATSGLKEVREVLEEAKRVCKFGELRTLLFLDEVHRFNKAQQDSLLSYVESGHIVFVGATTENPSSYAPLLSRCRVLTLNKLEPEHIRVLLDRSISDKEKGVSLSLAGSSPGDVIRVEEDASQFLAAAVDGDARLALNALEMAALAALAARESTPRRPWSDERGSCLRGDVVAKTEGGREVLTDGTLTKRDASSSLMLVPHCNLRMERSVNGFGMKRLEVLKESFKKENLPNSADDYTRPFKKFVGGKEVTPQVPMKEVKSAKEAPSFSSGENGVAEQDGGAYFHDAAAREMRNMDGSSSVGPENLEKRGHQFAGATEPSGSIGIATEMGKREKKVIVVTLQQVQEALQRLSVLHIKTSEEDISSALRKSMKSGDPDAAIYWLARVLESGEGPLQIARRLIRFASEDVGLTDPQALVLAVACYQACQSLGMPECDVNLAQCVTYLSLAPKSSMVYNAIEAAQQLVKGSKQHEPVPMHLRNGTTQLTKDRGYGIVQTEQSVNNLPPSLQGQKFLYWPEECLQP